MITKLIFRGQNFFPRATFSSFNSLRSRTLEQVKPILRKMIPELIRTFPNYEPIEFDHNQPNAVAIFNVIQYELGFLGCVVEKLNDEQLRLRQRKIQRTVSRPFYREALEPLEKMINAYLIEEQQKAKDFQEKSINQCIQFLLSPLLQNPEKMKWEMSYETKNRAWHYEAKDRLSRCGIEFHDDSFNRIHISLKTIVTLEQIESCNIPELKIFWSGVHQAIQSKAQDIANNMIKLMLEAPSKSNFCYEIAGFLYGNPYKEWRNHLGYLHALAEAVSTILKPHEDIRNLSFKKIDDNYVITIELKPTEYQIKVEEKENVERSYRP